MTKAKKQGVVLVDQREVGRLMVLPWRAAREVLEAEGVRIIVPAGASRRVYVPRAALLEVMARFVGQGAA